MHTNKPYEGLFITIEGGEGCGKSTLSDRLADCLQERGYRVLKTREPGGCPLSETIRGLLLNPTQAVAIGNKAELLLFLAARAQHVEERIKPALYEGAIVICERFNDSSIAYQGFARGLGVDYVEELCNLVVDEPDVTLLLDVDPIEGMERLQKEKKFPDRIEQEQIQFHREVRRGYLHLADEYPERIEVIDAALPVEDVLHQALEVCHRRLKKCV